MYISPYIPSCFGNALKWGVVKAGHVTSIQPLRKSCSLYVLNYNLKCSKKSALPSPTQLPLSAGPVRLDMWIARWVATRWAVGTCAAFVTSNGSVKSGVIVFFYIFFSSCRWRGLQFSLPNGAGGIRVTINYTPHCDGAGCLLVLLGLLVRRMKGIYKQNC